MMNENNEQNNWMDAGDNDRAQDTSNSDAAKFNADEQEEAINNREFTEQQNNEHLQTGTTASSGQNAPPLTTQGDFNEVEENLGGTTNLTLDQLKKEGDPEGEDA